jgi:DNA-binding NtrC family response regulator
LITTSSRDLSQAVREGSFHVELFHKLSVETIDLKPLRERKEDIISHLVPYFVDRACHRLAIPAVTLPTEVLVWLKAQPWPGNFGELEKKVQQLVNASRLGPVRIPV